MMNSAPPAVSSRSETVLFLVAALVAVYAISQFLRNSIGVIASDLSRELDLTATQTGLLSSAFFLSFAAAQIPVGIAIDRYGPKRAMLATAILAVAGTALFALAPSASVTGSKAPPRDLSSAGMALRKNGRIALPDRVASSLTKCVKSMSAMTRDSSAWWRGLGGRSPIRFYQPLPARQGTEGVFKDHL